MLTSSYEMELTFFLRMTNKEKKNQGNEAENREKRRRKR